MVFPIVSAARRWYAPMFEWRNSVAARLEEDDPRLVGLAARPGEHEAGLRFPGSFGEPHLLGELADRVVLAAVPAPYRAGTTMLGSTALTSLAASMAPSASPPPTGMTRTSTWPRPSISSSVSWRRRRPAATTRTSSTATRMTVVSPAFEAEDADAADLELAGTGDLLDLALARTQLGRIGDPLGSDDDARPCPWRGRGGPSAADR